MITGISKSGTLTKHISCRFDGRKCNSDQLLNNDKCGCDCKRRHVCEKDYIWNPSTWRCLDGKYLASIMDDSAIMCDKFLGSCNKETKTIPISFNENKTICKMQNFYILLAFLLNTIALLIVVSIQCYLIKYW